MLTSEQIYAFSQTFLIARYDVPVKTPMLHREMWDLCCLSDPYVALAAPREHAKSTAITHAFCLANVLFRESRYVLIVSDIQEQASLFLADIKLELEENEGLKEVFGFKRFWKDSVTDIIVEMEDGYKFRITAIGSEQKVRGRKWARKRPDLIIGDDLENDEMVESDVRREKFRNWFFKALVPCLSKHGRIRIVGTILHLDSMLSRLMKNRSWRTRLYKAHESFIDFSNILWPEQWPEERLRLKQQAYIDEGYPEGYSQEYLNNPIDIKDAFFQKNDFLPMEKEHKNQPRYFYGASDFAISTIDRRAFTVHIIGSVSADNILNIEHVERFRGDADEIIQRMLDLQKRYNVDFWKAERGQILEAINPALERSSRDRNIPICIIPGNPITDKRSRARPIQARMRVGGVRFDKEAEWYPALEEEMCQFDRGQFKDQVDAMAWLGLAINELTEGLTPEEEEDEEWAEQTESLYIDAGRNAIGGY